MTREARNDIVVAALLISLVLHAAGMLWVRPKVMTTVASGAERSSRRAPMRAQMVEHERPEPVKIEVVSDVAAEAEAPQAASLVSAAPLPAVDGPPAAEQIHLPEPEVPEVISRFAPGQTPLPLPSAEIPVSAPEQAVKMISDAVSVANPGPVDAFLHAPLPELPATPALSLSPVAIVEPPPVKEVAKIVEEDRSSREDKPFEPVADVMPRIDETVVEREKEAVRGLVDVQDAAELSPFVSVVLSSTVEGVWRYFRLHIMPKSALPTVPKDIVVIIDASGSIGRERMRSIRAAAKRLLRSATNSGDRFNMVAFRDRFSYAFKRWQECSVKSFDAADDWLDTVAPHGRTDVFSTIASVLTLPRDPARPMIALVVTDADANAGVSDTAEIVSRFSKLNDGLISVYMYGVKSSSNRQLIDALTRANRGESFVFDGRRSKAGSGIESLTERFRDPVLSDLRMVFSTSSQAEAYPRRLKNLYRGETLEVVGRVPAGVGEIAFSLRGLSGAKAYEGFFRLPVASSAPGGAVAESWRAEKSLDVMLR